MGTSTRGTPLCLIPTMECSTDFPFKQLWERGLNMIKQQNPKYFHQTSVSFLQGFIMNSPSPSSCKTHVA